MNKIDPADKLFSLMKLGLIVALGFVLMDEIQMLGSTALNGTPTLLLSGSVDEAHFTALLALTFAMLIREVVMQVPARKGIDGYMQWMLLMWIVPMLSAASLHWLIGSMLGLSVEIPEGGHAPSLFGALAFVMVIVMEVFDRIWPSLWRLGLLIGAVCRQRPDTRNFS